jgi:hypothetical protein
MGKADGSRPLRNREPFAMPIYRLLRTSSFNPEDVSKLVEAYESVLTSLNMTDRADPLTELVAQKIMDCAMAGDLDPARLRNCALAALMKN